MPSRTMAFPTSLPENRKRERNKLNIFNKQMNENENENNGDIYRDRE